jgi:ABC-type branched-subunit amino acid transport system substrate-binding protein
MNNLKKIIIVSLGILVILGIVLFTQKDNESNNTNEIVKVGVIIPSSGQYAVLGESVKNSILMSLQDLENKNIEVIFEDDEFDPKKSTFSI